MAEARHVSGEMDNVFNQRDKAKVPVKVVVDGKEITAGEATLSPGPDGIVHVDMDLKTDDPNDITDLFGNGITGYSMAVEPDTAPKHKKSEEQVQEELGLPPHAHDPIQHRDGKPPWCRICHLTADYQEPVSRFNFGKPALPLRRDGQ